MSEDAALEDGAQDDVAEAAKPEVTPEEQATKRGWKPLDQFTGPKDKWVPADEFLKRGEDEAPLLRANLKRLEEKFEKQTKTLAEFAEFAKKSEQRAYERAAKELQEKQDAAVAAGNVAEVRQITKEMTDLATEAKTSAVAGDDPVKSFEARNPWYVENAKARLWAKGLSAELAGQGMTSEAQLKEIERQVKTEFPDLFENERRNQAAAVEGKTAPGRKVKTFENLPPEAQAACDKFVKTVPGFSRADYVRSYPWS